MNARQTNKHSAYLVVTRFCDDPHHAHALQHIAAFQREYDAFRDLLPRIRERAQHQLVESSGVTEAKDSLREAMGDLGNRIVAGIRAFADVTGNDALLAEAGVTYSDFQHRRHIESADYAERVLATARAHIDELADYGIDADRLNQFGGLIERFSAAIGQPRLIIAKRRVATESLADLFDQADTHLDRMDNLAKLLELDYPEFVAGYRACRLNVHAAGRTGERSQSGATESESEAEPVALSATSVPEPTSSSSITSSNGSGHRTESTAPATPPTHP